MCVDFIKINNKLINDGYNNLVRFTKNTEYYLKYKNVLQIIKEYNSGEFNHATYKEIVGYQILITEELISIVLQNKTGSNMYLNSTMRKNIYMITNSILHTLRVIVEDVSKKEVLNKIEYEIVRNKRTKNSIEWYYNTLKMLKSFNKKL